MFVLKITNYGKSFISDSDANRTFFLLYCNHTSNWMKKQMNGAYTMKSEKSCGAIVLSPDNTNRKVLLIKHENGGHWAFPKGHVEDGETEVETALREIKEETGLNTDLSTAFRKSVNYSPAPDVMKEVVYFIAFAHTETLEKQDAEVTDFAWMPFNEALQAITYDNDKSILQSAIDFIEGMKN